MGERTLQFVMPRLGESVTEGTVAAWLKQEGDAVSLDEPIVEVETDKLQSEVTSPFSGTLRRILVEAGTTVAVGTVLAEIETEQAQ